MLLEEQVLSLERCPRTLADSPCQSEQSMYQSFQARGQILLPPDHKSQPARFADPNSMSHKGKKMLKRALGHMWCSKWYALAPHNPAGSHFPR